MIGLKTTIGVLLGHMHRGRNEFVSSPLRLATAVTELGLVV
jgi:hypothetical protein